MPSHLIIIALILFTWRPDETIRAYGAGDDIWHVQTLNGVDFTASATFRFSARHKIAGQGPCNSYSATMDIPFPWFGTGPIAATRRACPDLAAETAFFETLRAATQSEVRDGKLTLSGDDGVLMTFGRAD